MCIAVGFSSDSLALILYITAALPCLAARRLRVSLLVDGQPEKMLRDPTKSLRTYGLKCVSSSANRCPDVCVHGIISY